MRVIAGKARRLILRTIEGLDTRPTTDRIKETLFNMLNPMLVDCDFLDLFSGSGAIGIEALSRGAKSAIFVENNRAAVSCIKTNLNITGLEESAQILELDVISSLKALELKGNVFDVIFMDPPYNQLLERQVLEALQSSNIIYCNTIIIVEASLETSFEYLDNTKFQIYKQKIYKTNKHVFIEMRNGSKK